MNTEDVKLAYSNFSSSKIPDEEEISFLIKKKCQCDNCGVNILEMYDFPVVDYDNNELLCEDCEREKYVHCQMCEELFLEPITPEEHIFFISKNISKEMGMEYGIYQVKQFPFYYGNIVSGFESFFDNAIELVSKTDLEAINKIENREGKKISLDYICQECFDKYAGKKRLSNNYQNKNYGMHLNISLRGLINKS